jgi:hypothetical protein
MFFLGNETFLTVGAQSKLMQRFVQRKRFALLMVP